MRRSLHVAGVHVRRAAGDVPMHPSTDALMQLRVEQLERLWMRQVCTPMWQQILGVVGLCL